MDPAVGVFEARTMSENFGVMIYPYRLAAGLGGAFGLLALLLAAVGLYGVLGCGVQRAPARAGHPPRARRAVARDRPSGGRRNRAAPLPRDAAGDRRWRRDRLADGRRALRHLAVRCGGDVRDCRGARRVIAGASAAPIAGAWRGPNCSGSDPGRAWRDRVPLDRPRDPDRLSCQHVYLRRSTIAASSLPARTARSATACHTAARASAATAARCSARRANPSRCRTLKPSTR